MWNEIQSKLRLRFTAGRKNTFAAEDFTQPKLEQDLPDFSSERLWIKVKKNLQQAQKCLKFSNALPTTLAKNCFQIACYKDFTTKQVELTWLRVRPLVNNQRLAFLPIPCHSQQFSGQKMCQFRQFRSPLGLSN